ncbi:MAG: tetratricopeptide repeat protein [Sphingomonadales bacterium]|nr:tetratricopeptide repeat protein [Sphingomonadales bacterium]MBD3772452.1 tetratricopeptide repeat protein [Paracoccaceae bacterium]
MSWLPIILLGAIAFVVGAFVLRLPRPAWPVLGAALMFGLAGYALQGSPGYAGAPKEYAEDASGGGAALVDARRELFDATVAPSHWITVSDGFARQGQYLDAAQILSGAVEQDPKDGEAWLALGNALVEHADGMLTPAALYSYGKADALLPDNPAPAYFLGVALIRSGQLGQARQLWAETLARAPADAPWRELLAQRLARLDELIAQMGGQ